MDYDSSSKFISSLAKFLQSLCNGYVEFDNGVEVIGHIYLSVDTGKKIDYILNEKVCKTDENSVTFISNSFHAQPAEKPKPNSKKGRGGDQSETVENVVEIDDSSNQVEPKSTNIGTIPRNSTRNFQSSSPGLGKRPFSPHSKGGGSSSKKGRTDSSQEQLGLGNTPSSINSSDPLRGHPHQSSSSLPQSNSSQLFDPGYHPVMDNSNSGNSEERDIKPSMDTDVTFVKEEFASTQADEDGGGGGGLGDSFSSMYPSNQSYTDSPSGQSYGQQNSRLSYGGAGSDNSMYDNSMMSSQMEGSDGGAGADQSVAQGTSGKWLGHRKRSWFRPLHLPKLNHSKVCKKCDLSFINTLQLNAHKKECNGKRHLTCGVCSKVLSRYDALAEHLRGMHGIGNKVACRFCGKGFKYKPQVYQHQLTCPKKIAASLADCKIELNIDSESPSFLNPTLSPTPFPLDLKPIISFPYDPKACS